MRCLITGSNGYVGSCLRDYLRGAGHDVCELRRMRDGEVAGPNLVHYALGDQPPRQVFDGVQALIHCAYDFRAIAWNDIKGTNVDGSRILFEAAHRAGVGKLIFVSSISAFEGCSSLYGRAKLEIEACVARLGGVVIRPGLVYGDKPGGMVGTLTGLISKLPVVPQIGGSQQMYLCHQQDLARLVERVLSPEKPSPSAPIYACAPAPCSFKEILRTIARRLGRSRIFVPVPWPLAWLGIRSLEIIGLTPGVRSDSLISLMNPNPNPDVTASQPVGFECRGFS